MRRILYTLLVFSALPAPADAQTLAQRIATVVSGTVRLSFAARPGVCGDGLHNIRMVDRNDEWEDDCEPQPVRVALQVHERRVTEVRSYVGGRWRSGGSATELGTVRPQDAAAYFISLAERDGGLSGDPLLPAALADSITIWPALLRLARTPAVPLETRRTAVFWLGEAAGAAAARALDSIARDSTGDRDVRKQAVFALSQRSGNQGVPALLRIARTNPDPELRKTALFWLGQSEDPRALALFEEILR
ncbi:MAG TPA: HEAT repeat domain-containing protein [Gemmatimonadales bacterium]|nr:HEAT repeat domain-containing protein [Gemmatimonadales bacterium]